MFVAEGRTAGSCRAGASVHLSRYLPPDPLRDHAHDECWGTYERVVSDPPGSGLQTFTTRAAPPGTGRPSFTHPSTQDPGLSIYVPYLRTRQQLGSG